MVRHPSALLQRGDGPPRAPNNPPPFFFSPRQSAVWKAIKADGEPKAWAIFRIDDAVKNKLVVGASGRCGLNHIYKHLKDEEVRACFAVFPRRGRGPPRV
jgi:hypothetical protein